MTCQCSLSDLLQRSIELIDPPSRNSADECDGDYSIAELGSPDHALAAASVDNTTQVADDVVDQYLEHHSLPTRSTISLHESTVKKKVRFSQSCLTASKKVPISSIDATRAYELLIHAVSSIGLLVPSSKKLNCRKNNHFNDKSESSLIKYIDISSSWETLNDVVDIYRALLVTSCLLLEILPSAQQDDTSSAVSSRRENDTPKNIADTLYPLAPCNSIHRQNNYCPLQHSNNCPEQFIPTLTPSTINDILSTSRWCIHQLQLMERICAIKMILEHRRYSQNNSSSLSNIASLNDGGDDIHDYDRPISDWYANYDWHDDGFLPLPLFYHTNQRNIKDGANNNISGHFRQKEDDPSKSNILFECCYLPQYNTDPPSSRFEKIAWTRDWIRGERLVSLRMEDYQYCDEMCSFFWDGINALEGFDADSTTGMCLDGGDGTLDDENVSLDISSAILAEEESFLMDVVIVGEVPMSKSSHNCDTLYSSTKKRAGNMKEIRKKKRLKMKQKKELAEKRDLTTVFIDQNLPSQSIRGKEGFLLLVREETMGSLLPYLFVDKGAKTKTIRVFARLHPSGWLSLEDRSIRRQDCTENAMMQLRPLVPRVRYFDLFVCPETTCQPWIRNGVISFQFRVRDLLFLRSSSSSSSSSLSQSLADENASNPNAYSIESVDLLFVVDEENGGDFADGFEWVNCVSGTPME